MTSPVSEPTFTTPQANLALYGVLDAILRQAIEAGDAETAVLVNQYLPGAIEYPGWPDELRAIFGPEVPSNNLSIGDTVTGALNAVLNNDPDSLTVPDIANLIYIVGALTHFEAAEPTRNGELFVNVLALAGLAGFDESERMRQAEVFLREGLYEGLYGWQAWPDVINKAVENDWVEAVYAKVPQCSTSVVTVNGLECVVIDAEIESADITFNNMLAVVDPRNWPDAYSGFFCEMSGAAARVPPDKWWNVRETVGFCPVAADGGLGLTQRLRFLKSKQSPTDARLDFDLAEDQKGCTGRVLVDKGFVNMTCIQPDGDTTLGGVRLKTRKVAHIKGISPYAQAFWLCKLGYGWVALHLFFGKAYKPPNGYVKWKDGPVIDEPDNDPADEPDENDDDSTGSGGDGGVVAAAGNASPIDDTLAVATKTANRLAEVANYLTATNLDITQKWLQGKLNFGDLAIYGRDVGGKLASEPWKWLHDITTGTKPSKPPGGTP